MISYDEILEDIEIRIGEHRTKHTIRVAETAVDITKKLELDLDLEKVFLAGILHDCAKISDKDKLFDLAKEYDYKIDELSEENIELIHARLGAILAKQKYKVEDEDILNAISNHTTGRENMSDLEKVIFLADYIEPKRNFDGVDEARRLTYENLDEAMVYSLNHTIRYLIDKNKTISTESVKARNYILLNERENEGWKI